MCKYLTVFFCNIGFASILCAAEGDAARFRSEYPAARDRIQREYARYQASGKSRATALPQAMQREGTFSIYVTDGLQKSEATSLAPGPDGAKVKKSTSKTRYVAGHFDIRRW
jgi:hypothetical protein